MADILPGDTLLWKLQMMRSADSYANSRIHAVKAEVLILARWTFSSSHMHDQTKKDSTLVLLLAIDATHEEKS